ncbi:MAG TPA: heavy-metal-associated domain-containing protein, partial [Clostridiales bacterium]|nr:heavy-metal-associated domain-containing protein [Clostridiales bacterium]
MNTTQKFTVTGMTCSACSASVEKAVNKLDGIGAVSVNLLTNSMAVEY